MFVIRSQHMDAFSRSATETFEDRMVESLGARFPLECEELGEEGVRERIRDGMERSSSYEIIAERDVAHFIRLMFGIRPDFDTSRKTPWAKEILEKTQNSAGERLTNIGHTARTKGVKRN
jgi:hypothetical protein